MRGVGRLLRDLIRENLNEADVASLSDYTLSVSGTDQIRVNNIKTGKTNVSKNIEVMSSKWTKSFLNIKSMTIPPGGFNPAAADGAPILTVDVVIESPIPFMSDIKEHAVLVNRAALLKMADAILSGRGYSAPKKVKEDGSWARLIVNGGDGTEKG